MEALNRFLRFRLIYQETNIPLRGALTNHSNVDIGNGAEYPACNIRSPPDFLTYQANQCLVIFPSHIRQAFEFFCNLGQGSSGAYQN